MESLPQDAVARVIQQPEGILLTKALEADPLLVVVVREKVFCGLHQQRPLTLLYFLKTHVSALARQPGDAVGRDPAGFYQLLQTDQQGLPAKAERAA